MLVKVLTTAGATCVVAASLALGAPLAAQASVPTAPAFGQQVSAPAAPSLKAVDGGGMTALVIQGVPFADATVNEGPTGLPPYQVRLDAAGRKTVIVDHYGQHVTVSQTVDGQTSPFSVFDAPNTDGAAELTSFATGAALPTVDVNGDPSTFVAMKVTPTTVSVKVFLGLGTTVQVLDGRGNVVQSKTFTSAADRTLVLPVTAGKSSHFSFVANKAGSPVWKTASVDISFGASA